MESHGERRRQGPGRGRPDDGVDMVRGEQRLERLVAHGAVVEHGVTHVHRGAGVVLVLHFSFGQCRTVVDAPVDRLETAVDEAFLQEAVERLQSPCLVGAGHGFVGCLPAAEAADALKLFGLQVNVLLGVGAAGIQNRGSRHLQLFTAKFFVDLNLDRQAVAVEARNVGSVKAGHRLGLDYEIFEALVEGVTQVNGPVCVGRAVVEQIGRAAQTGLAKLLIEAHGLPAGQTKRLIVGQISLHREGGLRKGKGRLQLRRRGHRNSITSSGLGSYFSLNGWAEIFG